MLNRNCILEDESDKAIDITSRLVWNAEIPLVFDEDRVYVMLPITSDKLLKTNHIKSLSIYETKCDISAFNKWGLLHFFNGNNSAAEILEHIKENNPKAEEFQVLKKIEMLLEKGFINILS